ncbi:MAG: peptidylprolyl isomerase [Gemmatimonadota bacterium]|nr:peptidylprolyl isomerase [Gemmatimonadota bacterium]
MMGSRSGRGTVLGAVVALGVPSAALASGSEAAADTIVVIETTAGSIIAELDIEKAPRTAANFLRYVDAGLYEGGTVYRTVRQDNQPENDIRIEVIQGGVNRDRGEEAFDPIAMEGTGETGLPHLDGTISMARGDPDSARGEFFICIGDQPELNEGGRRNPDGRGFAAFGRVVYGMDVVRHIHRAATDAQTLVEPVEIVAVRTSARRGGADLATAPSAQPGFDAEGLIAAWVDMWGSYDLDRVRELFLPDARVNYLSSEREGLIVGIDSLMPHHEGFGFVAGGVDPSAELWVEDIDGVSYGNTAVVTGAWFFGDRGERNSAQRGPMTVVYTLYGDEYRIAHMHFANYEP